jgi:glycosyltransferase involved in cell wall biosynthesis
MESSKVSVCMTTYNGEKFILDQVKSILQELKSDSELIICDDGSTDNTINILQELVKSDSRIQIYINEVRLGVIKNFQICLSKSKGDYIFLADQDDIWLPGKVDKMINALRRNTKCVICNAKIIDGYGRVVEDSYFKISNGGSGFFKNFIKNSFLGCAMMITRDVLQKAIPFPTTIDSHDNWLGIVSELTGGTVFIPEQLILYRRHGSNASQMTRFGLIKVIWIRLRLLFAIVKILPRLI